jgi:hypothetical protein
LFPKGRMPQFAMRLRRLAERLICRRMRLGR